MSPALPSRMGSDPARITQPGKLCLDAGVTAAAGSSVGAVVGVGAGSGVAVWKKDGNHEPRNEPPPFPVSGAAVALGRSVPHPVQKFSSFAVPHFGQNQLSAITQAGNRHIAMSAETSANDRIFLLIGRASCS